jgi:hypothetical protein
MIPSCDLPPPPATPPSAIAAMLNLLEPHLYQIAKKFTTIDFIGRFAMTATEGHQRLNELAEDGLIASLPGQVVETWQLTRDGAYVLSPNRKRVTKKFVADVTACLQSIGPELLRQGAVELSIGGRPLAGKPNGPILVGLRLKNVPFASEKDDGLLQQLCAGLDAAVGSNGYIPMLFSSKVPLRLRDRKIIVANELAARTRGAGDAELIDEDEGGQAEWHARFRELHGLLADFAPFRFETGLPWGLLNVLEVSRFAEDLPLRGARSTWTPDDGAIVRLGRAYVDTYDNRHHRWHSWSAELFATLECRAATNSLPAFFEKLQQEQSQDHSFYMLNPLIGAARWGYDFESVTAHALLHYRAQLVETRAATTTRIKPKLAPHYLLFFDTLNFGSPRLIGFVRQPAGHNAHVNALVDRWDSVLKTVEGAASSCLTESGYYAGELCLDVREATPEETVVFHEVCKREGTSYRYWLFLPNNRMACLKAGRHEYTLLELDTPPLFCTATLGRRVQPRLLPPSRFGENPTLKAVVRAAKPRVRAALEQNIVFMDEVPMAQFARNAALRPCIDPVVLSSHLLEAWTFTGGEGSNWTAHAVGEGWSVKLIAASEALDMALAYGTLSETYRLTPLAEKPKWGRPYDNTLAALLGLLSTVRGICKIGLQQVWEVEDRALPGADDTQKLKWLARRLSYGLNSENDYCWPYLPASDETTVVPETSES